jgi:ABC transporter.
MSGNAVIEAHGLTKLYGNIKAVDGLDLSIYEGEIFGLLGPNGAGKTTTILMVMGLTEPTSGSVNVYGLDPMRDPISIKKVVSYMPDNIGFYDYMTGRENLLYTAKLNHIPDDEARQRIDVCLERVNLTEAGDRKVREYSRGMRQRLGIADVLIKDPKVIILDEPTLGIDPEGVDMILDLIVNLSKQEGKTIIVSSHLLYQMQEICDRLGIFVKGKLIACGKISELASNITNRNECAVQIIAKPFDEELLNIVKSVEGVNETYIQGGMISAICENEDSAVMINKRLLEAGYVIYHYAISGYSLDDIYRRYFEGEDGGYGALSK